MPLATRPAPHRACAALLATLLAALLAAPSAAAGTDDGDFRLTLVQMNDVYELRPLAGLGGLARVGTLLKRLGHGDGRSNVLAVLAGDLLSPSALGNAKVDGKALHGKQMVEVMNALRLDYATFGNHEFDLKAGEFEERLGESDFTWIASNITFPARAPYTDRIATSKIVEIGNGSGATARVGLLGLTLQTAAPPGIGISDDTVAIARKVAAQLRDEEKAELVIAITHLPLAQDIRLAEEVPAIDLILGGHEHENVNVQRGPGSTPIVKADANARTVYVHRLAYARGTRQLRIDSCLQRITAELAEDEAIRALIDGIVKTAYTALATDGIDPTATIATTSVVLDGRESSVRNGPTNLTRLIAQGMLESFADAQLAMFNSGSIRIDDTLEGALSGYDVLRILPYPGYARLVLMPGVVIKKLLDDNPARTGHGGFLQTAGVVQSANGAWSIGGKALDAAADYRVAINDFLLKGTDIPELDMTVPGNRIRPAGDSTFDLKTLLIAKLKQLPPAVSTADAPSASPTAVGTVKQMRCY